MAWSISMRDCEESDYERGYLSGDLFEDREHTQDYPLQTSCSSSSGEDDDFKDPPKTPKMPLTPTIHPTSKPKSKLTSKNTSTPHGRITVPVASSSLGQNMYKCSIAKQAGGDSTFKSSLSVASAAQGETSLITCILSELTQTLNKVVERMDNQEKRMKSMEKQLQATTSHSTPSSSSSCEPKKEKVPLIVRAEVRLMYRLLVEEDPENFKGFDTAMGASFKEQANQTTLERLIKEVRGCNPSFQAGHIRSAAYTYYRTLCQDSSMERRGVKNRVLVARRRRERISRKRGDRASALKKSSLPAKDKLK